MDQATKTCTSCNVDKSVADFYKHEGGKFGVKSICKPCSLARSGSYKAENADRVREASASYRSRNLATVKTRAANYYERNKDRQNDRSRTWALAHPERAAEINRRNQSRRRSTPRGKLIAAISKGVVRGLNKGAKAGRHCFNLLDYTVEDLRQRLESRFQDGMSWSNHGEWHIDHILPLASFDFETPDCPGFKAAWSLNNLQPLWAKDNISKRDRLDHPTQRSAA